MRDSICVFPLVTHRYFTTGAGWAFDSSLDGSVLDITKALRSEIVDRNRGEFTVPFLNGFLVGVRHPDETCDDSRARDRRPIVLKAALVTESLSSTEMQELFHLLWAFPVAREAGPDPSLRCALPRPRVVVPPPSPSRPRRVARFFVRILRDLFSFNRTAPSQSRSPMPRLALSRANSGTPVAFTINDIALVVLSDQLIVGHVDNLAAHVALRSPARHAHAMLIRHEGQYRVLPLWDQQGGPYPVTIGMSLVPAGGAFLKEGAELHFDDPRCMWIFRQPLPGSATAILQLHPEKTSRAVAPEFKCLVMMADECILGPVSGSSVAQSHVQVPLLPGLVRISRESDRLIIESPNAVLSVDDAGSQSMDRTELKLPCSVRVQDRPVNDIRQVVADLYQGRRGKKDVVLNCAVATRGNI